MSGLIASLWSVKQFEFSLQEMLKKMNRIKKEKNFLLCCMISVRQQKNVAITASKHNSHYVKVCSCLIIMLAKVILSILYNMINTSVHIRWQYIIKRAVICAQFDWCWFFFFFKHSNSLLFSVEQITFIMF